MTHGVGATGKIPFNTLEPGFRAHAREYEEAALRVLRSGWYVLGEEVAAFEREYAAFLGIPHCVGLNSGLDALALAVRALGIGPGDEIIVQANTYIATVLAITRNGAVPVFVEPDGFHGLDPENIRNALSPRTKAIMAVHLYGQPCDMGGIRAAADKEGLPVIEDCAQSHGALWNGMQTGTLGTIGCFSFFPTKNLGAFGDAGALATKDERIAERVRSLRNYGSRVKYVNDEEGINSRLDEIQAALLRVRLRHIGDINAERIALAERYDEGIRSPFVKKPEIRPGATHVFYLYVIETEFRDRLQVFLAERGIGTQIHYPIPPHLSGVYAHLGLGAGSFPRAERLARSVLSLPLYNGMSPGDVGIVCDAVNAFRP